MTNDTSTLTGALKEAGETLAANLTTQGVPSTWDEGLTTLIGKVLDITPGPGPTQSFDGISLTGNKSILSAADSEYVTLEAQLTDSGSAAAVSGETVTFTVYKSSDDSVVTTLTDDTDSSGLATVSYYGQGTGDIYIQAECTFVSETYSIEDALKYDNASTDNSSKYTSINSTLSWDTDHYTSVGACSSSTSNYFSFTSPNGDYGLPRNLILECDVKQTQSTDAQFGVSFTNSHGITSATKYATIGSFVSKKGIIYNSPWGEKRVAGVLSLDTWYHIKVTINGTTVSAQITDSNDNVLFNNSVTVSFMSQLTYINIHQGQSESTVQFKNLKIKPL